MSPALVCYCDGSCPGNLQNGTCEVRAGGQCFSAVEEVFDDISGQIEPEYSFGCLSPDQAGGLLQCNAGKSAQIHGKNIICCSNEDLCNKELLPDFNPRTTTVSPTMKSSPVSSMPYVVLFASVLFCLIAFTLIVFAIYITYKRRENKRNRRNRLMDPSWNGQNNISPITNLVEQSSGSGKFVKL